MARVQVGHAGMVIGRWRRSHGGVVQAIRWSGEGEYKESEECESTRRGNKEMDFRMRVEKRTGERNE